MIKFNTKLALTNYIATGKARDTEYEVDIDETLQGRKTVYKYTNGSLVLLSENITSYNWRTSVNTFADVAGIPTPLGMDAVVVLADETKNGQPTQYYHDGYNWIYNSVYFKESLEVVVSERNTRGSDTMSGTDFTIPLKYVVGSGHLLIYYDEVALIANVDFIEVGTLGTVSNKIQFKNTIPKEARLIFKRDIAGKYDETMSARKGKVDVYYFDTFTDAQNSPHLLDAGQVLYTFGHVTKNDGRGRFWILESTDKDFGYKNKANSLFINRLIDAGEVQPGTLLPNVLGMMPPESVVGSGQLANRADFKRIWATAVANNWVVTEAEWAAGKKGYFSSGDGSTTFRFPDFKDIFLRVKGSLVAVGTYIADTFKSHNHNRNTAGVQEQVNVYPLTGTGVVSGAYSAGNQIAQYTITGNSGSGETAPKHISEPYFIKV